MEMITITEYINIWKKPIIRPTVFKSKQPHDLTVGISIAMKMKQRQMHYKKWTFILTYHKNGL